MKLGNLVWHDLNNNGLQESGEPGINGVTVTLVWAGPDENLATMVDNVVHSVLTGPMGGFDSGEYYFDIFNTGKYKLIFTTPVGYVPTKSNVGKVFDGGTKDNDASPVGMDLTMLVEIFIINSLSNVRLGENGSGDNTSGTGMIILDARTDESHDAGFWQPCCPPNR